VEQRAQELAALTVEVLPEDGVKDDGRHAGGALCELGPKPLADIRTVNRRWVLTGHLERGVEELETPEVICPDGGAKRESRIGIDGIERRGVTTPARCYDHVASDGQTALEAA